MNMLFKAVLRVPGVAGDGVYQEAQLKTSRRS